MKKFRKLKLNQLSKAEVLKKREMNNLKGGNDNDWVSSGSSTCSAGTGGQVNTGAKS